MEEQQYNKASVYLQKVNDILEYKFHKSQRPINKEHVNKIVEDQIEEYKRYKSYSILQAISVVIVNGETVYVIDGQHRIMAFKELEHLGYSVRNVIVPVVYYKVIDETEMLRYFNFINRNMPIHPLELQSQFADYGKVLLEKLTSMYAIYLKHDSKNSLCPHINMNELKRQLVGRDLAEKLKSYDKSIEMYWDKIVELNTYFGDNVKSTHQLCPIMSKRIESCKLKADKFKTNNICYLGVWRKFEWLDYAFESLITNKDYSEISLVCDKNVRMHIPYIIRDQVWKKCNPMSGELGTCFTCCNDLYFRDMECGHIKAHALGGDISIDNLMPICKHCNKDMGIMNLFEYKNMIEKMNK